MSTRSTGPTEGDRASVPAADKPGVAAFDFDGTLARKDTFVPFLMTACGRSRVALSAAACIGRTRSRDRDELKVALVGRLFRGWSRSRLDDLGRAYAARLPTLLRPELVERVTWHRDQGHAIVIVSASLAVYLRPLAADLGIDDVLAVEMVADEAGVLTGAVVGGANTRGPLKAQRLRAWLDARYGVGTPVELWAYGDSAGDEELLAAADHPTWIGKRATTPV
jgi:phosphatidylglycerophosphatase C